MVPSAIMMAKPWFICFFFAQSLNACGMTFFFFNGYLSELMKLQFELCPIVFFMGDLGVLCLRCDEH